MLANASDDSRKEGCSTSSGDDPSMSFTHLGEQIGGDIHKLVPDLFQN